MKESMTSGGRQRKENRADESSRRDFGVVDAAAQGRDKIKGDQAALQPVFGKR